VAAVTAGDTGFPDTRFRSFVWSLRCETGEEEESTRSIVRSLARSLARSTLGLPARDVYMTCWYCGRDEMGGGEGGGGGGGGGGGVGGEGEEEECYDYYDIGYDDAAWSSSYRRVYL
jgi:hypothetical protein